MILLLNLIACTLVLYQAQRIIFLVYNSNMFSDQAWSTLLLTLLVGLRFDLSAIAILSLPAFLVVLVGLYFRNSPKVFTAMVAVFFIFQFPLLAVNFSDSEFIHFLGRRMTFHTFQLFAEIQPGAAGLKTVLYAWKLFAVSVLIFIGYLFLIRFIWQRLKLVQMPARKLGIVLAGIFIAIVIAARGGLQSKPLNFAHAQVFSAPALNMAVTNTGFSVLQTIKRIPLERDQYFASTQELLQYLNGSVQGKNVLQGLRPSKPQNVVLIILESFNYDYMGKPFGDKGFTPFLDQMAGRSLFLENAYANSRRSIEGIASVMAGIPSLMAESFINSQYVSNYFWGIGSLLAERGYSSAFFHGAKNGTMYFDRFMQSAGVNQYYGLNEYPVKSDYDGTWGIWDEPFMLWSAQKISEFSGPFFASVFTLSSHHPFKIPVANQNQFPKGDLDILESVGYADFALKKFFEYCETQSWYKDTLFVVSADHTYKNLRPDFKNTLGKFRIPIMFFHPSVDLAKIKVTEPVSQIDILPSILDFLNVPVKDNNYLGRSVFIEGARSVTLYDEGAYYTVFDNHVLRWVRGKNPEMFRLSDLDMKSAIGGVAGGGAGAGAVGNGGSGSAEGRGSFISGGGSVKAEVGNAKANEAEIRDKIEKIQKATLQYFSQGMWDNRLYYPSR